MDKTILNASQNICRLYVIETKGQAGLVLYISRSGDMANRIIEKSCKAEELRRLIDS